MAIFEMFIRNLHLSLALSVICVKRAHYLETRYMWRKDTEILDLKRKLKNFFSRQSRHCVDSFSKLMNFRLSSTEMFSAGSCG